MFDVEALTTFAQTELQKFAEAHSDETFYAFCITGFELNLNSEEAFARTLAHYRQKYPAEHEPMGSMVRDDEQIRGLKMNSGDWEYQGFAEFTEQNGFDSELHDEHYNYVFPLDIDATELVTDTPYGAAMEQVMALLVERDAFRFLKRTSDFSISREEYD